ncbi:MAG: hypothetical protein PF542_06145 [Nanoarchaeota archaeon]|jgi:NusA-like KH domain protein|nr:hypothetical protein [Nanoarchaeota archaeon]
MVTTINMEDLRHLNLFSKITGIQTRYCFTYNDTLIFAVPKPKITQALGKNNENLKRISEILKKRIKVIAQPRGLEDAKSFIQTMVSPVAFKEMEINDKEIIITPGSVQVKASLLGRNKRRLLEMQMIVKTFFNLDYRVA